jgi:hypothetical protein
MGGSFPKDMTHEDWEQIGYDKGYRKGREDQGELNADTVREIHELVYQQGIEKGRADTIEECADLFADILSNMKQICGINCPIKCNWGTEKSCKDICREWFIEQVKEQK